MAEEYLYHYTSIETLALILSRKTIRFNSLDKVDDLQEVRTADMKNIGQFCFVSSWTDDETESIPMWKMYGSLESGVRIRLRRYPFYEHKNKPEEIETATGMPVEDKTGGKYPQTLIPYYTLLNEGFITFPLQQKDILYEIEYTNDRDKIIPYVMQQDEESISIATDKLGKYKNTHWRFQKEWRYIIMCYPIDVKRVGQFERYITDINRRLLAGVLNKPFDYYDLKLENEAFRGMQITMSPQISEGSKIIVNNLIEKYNPSAEIVESTLVGKI